MWSACLATTFPSPVLPEAPLMLSEWAGIAWFAVPVFLVTALALASLRTAATSARLRRTFNIAAVLSLAVFAATASLITSGYEGALDRLGGPSNPLTGLNSRDRCRTGGCTWGS